MPITAATSGVPGPFLLRGRHRKANAQNPAFPLVLLMVCEVGSVEQGGTEPGPCLFGHPGQRVTVDHQRRRD